MAYQRESRFNRRWGALLERRRNMEVSRLRAWLYLGLTLMFVATSTVPARAQASSSGEVPVALLSDHILREGDAVFMTTAYPMNILDDQGKPKMAASGSFIRCKAAGHRKNSLLLSECQMLLQLLGDNKTYSGNLIGTDLSIRWRNRLFWDQLVNAGETWQGAVGSFAIGSTAALFTNSHTIMGVGTAIGFALTGVGPLAKHHPAWFLYSKKSAIPDTRTLLFNPGPSILKVVSWSCVGGCTAEAGQSPGSPSPQSGTTDAEKAEQ